VYAEGHFSKRGLQLQTLPAELLPLIVELRPLFSKPVWKQAQVLLIGAILAPGKRTVTACLRVMGLSQEKRFVNYHRVLNRANWSALTASRILLRLLVAAFAPNGELVLGIDDTIERRRGEKIKAKGIYRDPVRSSKSHACGDCRS
jgi:DDE superfamily endonuclease